ncbi:hypothetical protein [Pantoea ananatis]|uniref:hypothetical protein n=1 Tax=Pantoea ananas TaxID=553 RepID=UPI0021AA5206|nr:hypothetical protein [Pantoea ananatis]UYL03692.1 hypothetical protein NG830_10315 [Pantoea ananatis]
MRLIQHCAGLRFQRSTRIRIRQAGRGGTRGPGGFMRVVNVKRLGGNVVDQLRLLQAALLFLFVENRADAAVVGMVRVTAQAGQILLLHIPVADNDERSGFDTGKLAIITVKRGRMVIELDINL